jgi:hypothetical protein
MNVVWAYAVLAYGCGLQCVNGRVEVEGRCVCPAGTGGASCTPTADAGACDAVSVFYRDADEDAFGDTADMITACAAPAGYVALGGDCAPEDPSVHPEALEVCDGVDQDCDEAVDEEAPFAPGRAESCDGADQDCDGRADEGLPLALGSAVDIAPSQTRVAQVALVAVASGYAAVWVDQSGGRLTAQLLDEEGGPRSSRILLDGEASEPTAALLDGDRIVVTWRTPAAGGGSDLRARIVRLDDGEADAPVTVSAGSSSWLGTAVGESRIAFAYVFGSEVRARTYALDLRSPSPDAAIYSPMKFVRMQRVGLAPVAGAEPYFMLGVVGLSVERSFVDRVSYEPLASEGSLLRVDTGPDYARRVVLSSAGDRVDAMLANGGIELVRMTPGALASPLVADPGIAIERAPGNAAIETIALASTLGGTDLAYVTDDGELAVAHRFVDRDGNVSARLLFGRASAISGVAVARRAPRSGGVLYETGPVPGSVVFQPIRCE